MPVDFDITPYVEGWKKRMAEAEAQMAARKKEAFADAQKIARVLKDKYGCTRVVGIGSTFNDKDFTEHSDIDLVAFGISPQKYFSISAEISDLTAFRVDLIPAEDARSFTLQIAAEEGVEL
jgi:predicted nucleotidyltransferase